MSLKHAPKFLNCNADTVNCGKVTFGDSGTVLCYYIGQTFLATFRFNLDLLQAYNDRDTDQNARYK